MEIKVNNTTGGFTPVKLSIDVEITDPNEYAMLLSDAATFNEDNEVTNDNGTSYNPPTQNILRSLYSNLLTLKTNIPQQ